MLGDVELRRKWLAQLLAEGSAKQRFGLSINIECRITKATRHDQVLLQ
jgi:hypothetical protein